MKRRNIAIMAMLALTAGQAFAQRCLPQMKGIEVKVGMADGVYNGKKSCKAGYYAGLGLSSYTKGGDKWTYGAEYLQVHQPYRETSVPIAQMTGEPHAEFSLSGLLHLRLLFSRLNPSSRLRLLLQGGAQQRDKPSFVKDRKSVV